MQVKPGLASAYTDFYPRAASARRAQLLRMVMHISRVVSCCLMHLRFSHVRLMPL